MPPSHGANYKEYIFTQNSAPTAINDGLMGREARNETTGAPIGIFNPVFKQFVHEANDARVQPTDAFIGKTQDFIKFCSLIQTSEEQSNIEAREWLSELLGTPVVCNKNEGNMSSDGVIMLTIQDNEFPIMILERTKMIGEGACDPSIQAGLSMRRAWIQDGVNLSDLAFVVFLTCSRSDVPSETSAVVQPFSLLLEAPGFAFWVVCSQMRSLFSV